MENNTNTTQKNNSTEKSPSLVRGSGAYYLRIPDKKYPRWAQEILDCNAQIFEKPVELRSEKVRNIIGQVPHVLLRYGIMIIALALLILVGVSAFLPYQPGIDTEITVTQDENGLLHFSTVIPQDVIHKINTRRADSNRKAQETQFSEVISETASELSLPTRYQLENISDTVTLSGQKAWYSATLIPTNNVPNNIQLENKIVVPGKILLEKRSVLMWVVKKMHR